MDIKIKGSRPICVDMENPDKLSEGGVGGRYRTVNIYYNLLYQQQKNCICRYTNLLGIFSGKKPIMLVTLGNQGIVRVGESSF